MHFACLAEWIVTIWETCSNADYPCGQADAVSMRPTSSLRGFSLACVAWQPRRGLLDDTMTTTSMQIKPRELNYNRCMSEFCFSSNLTNVWPKRENQMFSYGNRTLKKTSDIAQQNLENASLRMKIFWGSPWVHKSFILFVLHHEFLCSKVGYRRASFLYQVSYGRFYLLTAPCATTNFIWSSFWFFGRPDGILSQQ